jgi:hypothetical protein
VTDPTHRATQRATHRVTHREMSDAGVTATHRSSRSVIGRAQGTDT